MLTRKIEFTDNIDDGNEHDVDDAVREKKFFGEAIENE